MSDSRPDEEPDVVVSSKTMSVADAKALGLSPDQYLEILCANLDPEESENRRVASTMARVLLRFDDFPRAMKILESMLYAIMFTEGLTSEQVSEGMADMTSRFTDTMKRHPGPSS